MQKSRSCPERWQTKQVLDSTDLPCYQRPRAQSSICFQLCLTLITHQSAYLPMRLSPPPTHLLSVSILSLSAPQHHRRHRPNFPHAATRALRPSIAGTAANKP
jgi:hypothetical protein